MVPADSKATKNLSVKLDKMINEMEKDVENLDEKVVDITKGVKV